MVTGRGAAIDGQSFRLRPIFNLGKIRCANTKVALILCRCQPMVILRGIWSLLGLKQCLKIGSLGRGKLEIDRCSGDPRRWLKASNVIS